MTTFQEISVVKEPNLVESLTKQERVFVYYMFRASLPFNSIIRDQNHRYNNDIIRLFEYLYKTVDKDKPIHKEIATFLVYLWTNNGTYFMREGMKRTPRTLKMVHLTENSIMEHLRQYPDQESLQHLIKYIFEESETRLVVDGSIEGSSNNFYGSGFTKEHYEKLPTEDKGRINAYPYLDNGDIKVAYHSVNGRYGKELTVSVYWLIKAVKHAANHPDNFDQHIISSLKLLIEYFETGEELKFKQHSIEWLKTNSRIDYVAGFIEQYDDPMGVRGAAAAEITVKTTDMNLLNPILLEMEQRMPIPDEYKKRTGDKTILNVSVNGMVFGAGNNGPQVIIAAYCLPNYNDIRAEVGSKQVIYKLPKSDGDKELAKQMNTKRRLSVIEQFDPYNKLYDDLWDVQVLLHETSHASGRLHKHTFIEGENLTIGGKTYQAGDVIDVTDDNYSLFISEDSSSLEELRAEINALYMSVAEMGTLNENGLYKEWVTLLGEHELSKECVINMCQTVFNRYLTQTPDMTSITGAHARANVVITNYLLDGGGIVVIDEIKMINGLEYHLLDIDVVDLDKAMVSIVELVQLVQQIKSTADTIKCKELFDIYTNYPITVERAKLYKSYMLAKKRMLKGDIKTTTRLFPMYNPVIKDGEVDDIICSEMDIFEQNFKWNELMLSIDL